MLEPEPDHASVLRADARRNRDALLTAARDVFAEQGLDAPLDAIAKAASVGRATLYRRFPTRDALIDAIFDDTFVDLEEIVRTCPDPALAYFEVLRGCMQLQAENRGFIELFARQRPEQSALPGMQRRFLAVVGPSLARAQAAGHVRPDLTALDTVLLVDMLAVASKTSPNAAEVPHRQEWAFTLLLDAIAPNATPRPLSAPTTT